MNQPPPHALTHGAPETMSLMSLLDDRPEEAATGWLGQVDETADTVVFLLSNRSGVVTGSVIDRDQNIQGCFD